MAFNIGRFVSRAADVSISLIKSIRPIRA